MAFERHVRMTLNGHFRDTANNSIEIFSYGLSMGRVHNEEGTQDPDFTGDKWDDIAVLAKAFHKSDDLNLSSYAILDVVKFADIGPDGTYLAPPREVEIADGGGGGGSGYIYPLQVSHACSQGDAKGLHPVRGRFYLPGPMYQLQNDARLATSDCDNVALAQKVLIEGIYNRFWDDDDYQHWAPVIASQKTGVGNAQILELRVGRVLDTQRRRRNDLSEDYITNNPVPPT